MEKVGKDGVVTVEEGRGLRYEIEYTPLTRRWLALPKQRDEALV